MLSGRAMVFATERLIIRTATAEDVDLFYALWTGPQVTAHVGFPQGLRITRDEIKDQLSKQPGSAFEHWRRHQMAQPENRAGPL